MKIHHLLDPRPMLRRGARGRKRINLHVDHLGRRSTFNLRAEAHAERA